MALYEVILNQNYYGQNCVNRWNYVSTGTPAAVSGSFALASALGAIYDLVAVPPAYPDDTLIAALVALQSESVSFTQLTVLNPYDPIDFYQTPFDPALIGDVGSDGESPAVSYGFRTNVVNRSIRRGTKRFVGVAETGILGGGVLSDPALALCATVAEKMSETLSYDDEGNTLSFAPAICSKEKYTVDGSSPARYAYRYYSTLSAQLVRTALGINWEAYEQTRTQTSRQYGRGQ